MDDLLSEFLTESAESLEVVDAQLVQFEADPTDRATLDNIFRLIHTIKGTCGFLGLPRLEAIAHAGETLLGKFRDGALKVSPEAVTLVLQSIDRIKDLLSHLELVGVEPEGQDRALIAALEAMSEGTAADVEGAVWQVPLRATPIPAGRCADPARADRLSAGERDPSSGNGPYDAELGRNLRPGEVSLADLEAAFQSVECEVDAPAPGSEPAIDDSERTAAFGEGGVVGQSIRVNLEVLENLMTMVSELVLTRNQLLQMVRTLGDSAFTTPLQRLSVITGELQDSVMKTRMQPIGAAWKKLPRIVRDVATEVGKKIDLVMEGEATELDRQVLELIKDPLTHMVRNSADHGLETSAQRRAAGKPETGTIRLSAVHEGGFIVIRIADDGEGLNTARIRQKAVAKGLVSAGDAVALSDAQVHRFIFAPGFSTAETVTNLSGRGVGMDVVRTNIEQIGGHVEVISAQGKGAAFVIKIPLTLAIVSALIVEAAGQRFAIPQLSVRELVRTGGASAHQVEIINDTRVLRLRERLLPLVSLSGFLELESEAAREVGFVVVMQVGGRCFGVAVDDVFDTEEIVVKPLAALLREVQAFSGATILGDGAVVLILDPNTLAESVGEKGGQAQAHEQALYEPGAQNTAVLVIRAGDATPKAVPLALVTRLEDIAAGDIERSSGRAVVQYRGKLMPLVHAANDAFVTQGKQPVLVFTDGDRVMGLAVDEIVDIVEEPIQIELSAARSGVVGSMVLRGKATDVLDVAAYLTEAFSGWFEREGDGATQAGRRRILLVDDSAFFRNMMAPLLSAAGYEVTTVPSPDDAWRLHADGAHFDAIVSDIEMPGTDGYTFAAELGKDSRWAGAPRIALTGLPVAQTLERAPAGAFNDVVRKSDRQGLIEVLSDALKPGKAA